MTDILLESGTNELEIVEFYIDNVRYGVNVTKVEEVRMMPEVRKMPENIEEIIGFFDLRGDVIPVINLPKILRSKSEINDATSQVIVMHFNQRIVGFLVERVIKIIRLSWTNIISPPISFDNHPVIGVIVEPKREHDLIQLIDFEKIMEDISPTFQELVEAIDTTEETTIDRKAQKVWLAEDSKMIQSVVGQGLTAAGYENQTWFNNGADAWNAIEQLTEETLFDEVDILVSDIEMPQMDGLHLVKRIKEDPLFRQLPVVMFSSLINESTAHKCKSVGADAQTSKPEVTELIVLLDELIQKYALDR